MTLSITDNQTGKVYRAAGDVLADNIGHESFQDAMLGISMADGRWFISYMPTNGKKRIYRFFLDNFTVTDSEVKRLQEREGKMRKALGIYANKEIYKQQQSNEPITWIDYDSGSVARATLEELGETK